LFHQKDQETSGWEDDSFPEDFLTSGHVRLGIPIDTLIYHLLRSDCAKGAKQAEELIKTAQSTSSTLQSKIYQMQPVFFTSILCRPLPPAHFKVLPPPHLKVLPPAHFKVLPPAVLKVLPPPTSLLAHHPPAHFKVKTRILDESMMGSSDTVSTSSDSSNSSETSSGYSSASIEINLPNESSGSNRDMNNSQDDSKKQAALGISGDVFGMEKKFFVDNNTWNVTIMDSTTVVAMYGDTTYPLLMWNPGLKVDFQLTSSIKLFTGTVTLIDPSQPIVTFNVVNRSPHRVAFSVIVHRQSSIFHSHVVYPARGLHILEQNQCWEDNAEFYLNPKSLEMNEYFIIDVFVAALDGNGLWNILRKYAIMKGQKSHTMSQRSRQPSKRFTQLQMPGNSNQKEENLRQIITHGLQCVVKSKLNEAEIIFTQALHLPDFQHVPLKAFIYICLAIIMNKRKKQGYIKALLPVLTMLNGATQLVEVYENTPGAMKMPCMLQLVKQLKKELNNDEKIITQQRLRECSSVDYLCTLRDFTTMMGIVLIRD